MQPFRIAVLIFVVGASAANLLALKLQHDRFTYPTTAKQTESATTPDPWAVPDPNLDPGAVKLHVLANDLAYLREAIILTIGGVAWFLVKTKT
jgi:hypothetical protein